MSEPFEIIAAPFTAYVAPVGEAFPAVDADPAGNWVKIGTNGDESMDEEGVTVQHAQELNKVRSLGSTAPLKAFRTAEDLMISFTLLDVTLEATSLGLNSNTVATTAAGSGTAGFKTLQFYQGEQVATMALLLRAGVSPYAAAMNMQYQLPRCFQSGNPEPVYRKGEPAGFALEFTALKDPNAVTKAASFGQLVIQHQVALP
ncbi:hypothetical protein [uncultured Roseibium sp.]|uniref:hypothetical protein n=1 Tax=uncultured Roseibium sp. TaxID=1936171 RepID=UPI003217817A